MILLVCCHRTSSQKDYYSGIRENEEDVAPIQVAYEWLKQGVIILENEKQSCSESVKDEFQ